MAAQDGFDVDVTVIGLGYVGLPLAAEACRAGLAVRGLDLSEGLVSALGSGRSHVDDLSDDDVADMLATGFRAGTDPEVLSRSRTVVICVPTPLSVDGGPDLSAVESAARVAASAMRPGSLLVLESTTYPGTTEDLVQPLLEAAGHVVGQDVFLAFSPERIDPGNETWGVHNTPKVVGGATPACTERAAEFYGRFVQTVVRASGTKEAEMAKLLENTYRHINIALVNEMSRFCHEMGVDLWDVIRCASTKPFGFQAFYPGPGVGGHCIPIDPNYLSYQVKAKLGYAFRFVELAQEINVRMPAYVVRRVQDLLNDQARPLRGATVLLLGVTYKPDIADTRESPASAVAQQLAAQGAMVRFHDPLVQTWRVGGVDVPRVDDARDAAASCDVTVLLQHHHGYDLDSIAAASPLFFDTRGVASGPTVSRL